MEDALKEEIHDRMNAPDPKLLIMADLTKFSWDKLFIFAPYTPIEEIEDKLGFSWRNARSTRIYQRDDACLLVFVEETKVTYFIMFPRNLGDFSQIYANNGLTAKEAVFEVRKTQEEGLPLLMVHGRTN